ncbi:hypothetical protein AB0M22_44940 [Nocardia sp. NPDC051756]|uniref:hypothetical protein n=1 Tax=Nocardia sp. NPDC051756 TaxID=3154751 RepID=UPI003427BE8B
MASTEFACQVRVFQLHRDTDVSGFSGVGVVADGCVWPDGTVSMRWRGPIRTTVEAACLNDIRTVHGHDGKTRVVLLPDEPKGGAAKWTAA